jgi:hypothetical protein
MHCAELIKYCAKAILILFLLFCGVRIDVPLAAWAMKRTMLSTDTVVHAYTYASTALGFILGLALGFRLPWFRVKARKTELKLRRERPAVYVTHRRRAVIKSTRRAESSRVPVCRATSVHGTGDLRELLPRCDCRSWSPRFLGRMSDLRTPNPVPQRNPRAP